VKRLWELRSAQRNEDMTAEEHQTCPGRAAYTQVQWQHDPDNGDGKLGP
jgi:hypothetical protein